MGATGESSAVAAILKREDCKQTKHDSNFSRWQLLIGASDWEDHSQGKEGASRYRVNSLPTKSGPGFYELGVAVLRSGLGRDVGKLDPDAILVVYIGQADNVRTRLQCYGRSGAHLSKSYSPSRRDETSDGYADKGIGLFEQIFSRGYSIVFRWASVNDKRHAKKIEAKLLANYDYAWNKDSNGTRRPDDILQKLDKIASRSTRFPNVAKKLLSFRGSQVGIKIKANKPLFPEESTTSIIVDSKNFLAGVFKFSGSRPRLVSDKCSVGENFSLVCGVIVNDGTACRRPPVPGRKRCEEHKGMRVYGPSSKSVIADAKHCVRDLYVDSSIHNNEDVKAHNTLCGVNLGGGTSCRRPVVAGRKRCEERRGMRVNSLVSQTRTEDKLYVPAIPSVFSRSGDLRTSSASTKIGNPQSSNSCSANEHFSSICGATLVNGSYCSRQPVEGNKRCWQHKGKRADYAFPRMDSSVWSSNALTCGATLQNGSACTRAPVPGRKRCERHKGMRVSAGYSD